MDKKRNIKKKNYYLLLLFSLFQLSFLIYRLNDVISSKSYKFYIRITNWSFFICIYYLISISICDTNLYFFSSLSLEKYNAYIRNSLAKIAFPYCFMITIGFWGIIIFGLIIHVDTFFKRKDTMPLDKILNNLNTHCLITIMMVIDLFLNEKEEIKSNYKIFTINTIIFLLYCIVVCIAKFKLDLNAYIFLENIDLKLMFFIGIIIYLILIGCIYLYIFVSNKINRKYFKLIEVKKGYNLIEMNKIIIPE